MVCEHLRELEALVQRSGVQETYRGRAWSVPRGEWVYFRCYLDRDSVMARFSDREIYEWSEHRGTHDGSEAGVVCKRCECAIMGLHPEDQTDAPLVRWDEDQEGRHPPVI